MYDFALAEGSEILDCDGALSKFEYNFFKLMDKLLTTIHSVFYSIPFLG